MNILLRLLAVSTGLGLCACGSDSAESHAPQNPPVATQPPGDTPNTPPQPQPETPADTGTSGDHTPGGDESEEPSPSEEPPSDGIPEEAPPSEESPSVGLSGLTLIEPADVRQLTPRGKMVFSVDETIDDISALAEGIRLRNASDTSLIPLNLEIAENTRTLTLQPRLQLEPGERYSLEILAQDSETGIFRSAHNAESIVLQIPELVVSKIEFFDLEGDLYTVTLLQESPIHQLPRSIRFSDPGSDGTWLTADDGVAYYSMKTVDQDNRSFTEIKYDNPGTNSLWFDDDDIAASGYSYSYHQSGALQEVLRSFHPGANSTWFDEDDDYNWAFVNDLDGQGRVRHHINFDPDSGTGKGDDGVWFTADDDFGMYTRFDYENGFLVRKVNFIEEGDDAAWLTEDDEVHRYTLYTYSESGELAYQYEVSSPGQNGSWFDSDDELTYFTHHVQALDAAGMMKRMEIYKSNFPQRLSDASTVSFTLNMYRVTYYDAVGRPTFSGSMNRKGRNQVWFDDDDYYYPSTESQSSQVHYFDSAGLTDNWWVRLEGPGDDGLWRTGDEPIGSSMYHVVDEYGREILFETYRSAGDDNNWLTRDDNQVQIRKEYDIEPVE